MKKSRLFVPDLPGKPVSSGPVSKQQSRLFVRNSFGGKSVAARLKTPQGNLIVLICVTS